MGGGYPLLWKAVRPADLINSDLPWYLQSEGSGRHQWNRS